MNFKTHAIHPKQIRAALRVFPKGVWFHGCGNIYVNDRDSETASTFFNPAQKEMGFRVKFTHASQVPDSIEELNKMLIDATQKEEIEKSKPKTVQDQRSFTVEEEDEAPHRGPGRPKKEPA